MKTLNKTLFLIAFICFNFSYSQIVWEKINGPLAPATPFSFLVTSSGTQFIGTDNEGLFRSTDEGQSWELKTNGINSLYITALAEAPNGWIYAGTHYGGVSGVVGCLFRSQDNGESWQLMINNDPEVRVIKINSVGHIFIGTNHGFYKSTNNGAIWSLYNNGLLSPGIFAMEVVTDSTIYVATDQGIHVTIDEGYNWIPKNQGLPHSGNYIPTYSIFCRHDTLYTTSQNKLFFSTNFGDLWIQRAEIPVDGFLIDSNNVFYIRQEIQKNLLRSVDYGNSWDTLFTFPDWFTYFTVVNNKIFAGIYSEGLLRELYCQNNYKNNQNYVDYYNQGHYPVRFKPASDFAEE